MSAGLDRRVEEGQSVVSCRVVLCRVVLCLGRKFCVETELNTDLFNSILFYCTVLYCIDYGW